MSDKQPTAPDAADQTQTQAQAQAQTQASAGAVFTCAACGHSQSLPERLRGRRAKCPKCGVPGSIGPLPEVRELDERDVVLDDLVEADAAALRGRAASAAAHPEGLALDAAVGPVTLGGHLGNFFAGSFPVNVLAGLLGGAYHCLVCLALSLLVFGVGGAQGFAPHALALTLLPAVLGSVLLALNGRLSVAVGGPDPSVVLAVFLLLSALSLDLAGRVPPQDVTATLVAGLALASLLSGALGVLLSRFGLAELVRTLPAEALGGMLAGFGLLLVKAWLKVMTLSDPALALLSSLPLAEIGPALVGAAASWGPAVGLALLITGLYLGLRGILWPLLTTVLAIGAWNLLTHGAAALSAPLAELARTQSALPPMLDLHCTLQFFEPETLLHIQWLPLVGRLEFFAAVAVVAILPSVLRTSLLETVLCREADAEEQARMVGASSLLSGLLGALPSSVSLSGSLGLRALGANGPVAGFIVGLVCLGFLLGGQALLPFIPKFVPQGLLLAIGLIMPVSWLLRDARNVLSRPSDIRLAWASCLLVALLGPVLGVFLCLCLGLAASLASAVSGGSVRFVQTGDVFHSNVERPSGERRILRERSQGILILRLQGFLFLGGLYGIRRIIRERLAAAQPRGLTHVLLDFRAVSGLGASAAMGFRGLETLAREHGLVLFLTSVPLEMEERLEGLGYGLGDEQGVCRLALNLDYALEWCEDRLLAEAEGLEQHQASLEQLLAASFPEPQFVAALVRCLERVDVPRKQRIITQGAASDSLYFLQSGKVQVELALPDGRLLRLRKMGPGTLFGEMGLYTSAPRSASVIATEPCVAYRLSAERFRLIQSKAPQLAAAVNRFVVTLLAERLAEENAKTRAAATQA